MRLVIPKKYPGQPQRIAPTNPNKMSGQSVMVAQDGGYFNFLKLPLVEISPPSLTHGQHRNGGCFRA